MEINADKITTGQIDAAEREWIEQKVNEMIEQYQKEKPFDEWHTSHPAPEANNPYFVYDDNGPPLKVEYKHEWWLRHANDTADHHNNTYHYYDTGNNFFSPIYINPDGVDMEFFKTQNIEAPDTAEQEPEEIEEEDFLGVLESAC